MATGGRVPLQRQCGAERVPAGILYPRPTKYPYAKNHAFQSVLGLAVSAGQGLGGLLVHFFRRHHRWTLIASTVFLTAFSAAMVSVEYGDRAKGIGLMLMASLAVGVIETASLSLAPLSCPPEDLGVALGTLGSIRSAGGSIGGMLRSASQIQCFRVGANLHTSRGLHHCARQQAPKHHA